MPTLAPKLPYTHPFAGGYPRIGGQPLPSDPDAIDYLERVAAADGAAVEVGVAMAVDQFIKGCKSDSAGYAGDPTRTVWDAIKSACIMCGARTLSGALVSLKSYGDELVDIDNLPTPSITDYDGSAGEWNPATRTLSAGAVGGTATFPRFKFAVGMEVGKKYRAIGKLLIHVPNSLDYVRIGTGTLLGGSEYRTTGEFDQTLTATTDGLFGIDLDATIPGASVTIESLSIKEYFANPTNVANNFVEADYDRSGGGLKGDGATKYLDTNRANDADGQDDQHASAYVSSQATATSVIIGSRIGGDETGSTQLLFVPGAGYSTRVHGDSPSLTPLSLTGFYGARRSAPGSFDVRIGSNDYNYAAASQTPNPENVHVFRRSGTTSNIPTDARLAFYSIGSALDLAALDTRVTNLINGIKFHSLTGLVATDYDPDTVAYIVSAYEAGGTL